MRCTACPDSGPPPLAPPCLEAGNGAFDLLALVSDQAEAQDLSLERAAKKFTAVEVPENSQGWRWHPWLGITKQH